MNKILKFINHLFVKLIFNKLKEIFGSEKYKDLAEPIIEEVVILKPVAKKSVASKPVNKKITKKTTNKK